jgi:hypothetical protein
MGLFGIGEGRRCCVVLCCCDVVKRGKKRKVMERAGMRRRKSKLSTWRKKQHLGYWRMRSVSKLFGSNCTRESRRVLVVIQHRIHDLGINVAPSRVYPKSKTRLSEPARNRHSIVNALESKTWPATAWIGAAWRKTRVNACHASAGSSGVDMQCVRRERRHGSGVRESRGAVERVTTETADLTRHAAVGECR